MDGVVGNREFVTFSIPLVTEDYSNATITVQGEVNDSIMLQELHPIYTRYDLTSPTVFLYITLPIILYVMFRSVYYTEGAEPWRHTVTYLCVCVCVLAPFVLQSG